MPIPGTELAPEKFKGEYNYVSQFIQHYECLCDQNNVILGKEKCETVTQYCSKKVGEFIKALDSYSISIQPLDFQKRKVMTNQHSVRTSIQPPDFQIRKVMTKQVWA